VFTPFELVARHRNADADVEIDAAIVNPTRVATIKRFIIGPFQVQCDNRRPNQSGSSSIVNSSAVITVRLVEASPVGIEWIVGFFGGPVVVGHQRRGICAFVECKASETQVPTV
jgi:hypothetical protein